MLYNNMYMGGVLVHGERSHKYIDKIRTKTGKWRYIYRSAKPRPGNGFFDIGGPTDLHYTRKALNYGMERGRYEKEINKNKYLAAEYNNASQHEYNRGNKNFWRHYQNMAQNRWNKAESLEKELPRKMAKSQGIVNAEMRDYKDRINTKSDRNHMNKIEKIRDKVSKILRKYKKKK